MSNFYIFLFFLILCYLMLSYVILSLFTCDQNVKIQSTHVWEGSCLLLNRTLVYLSRKLQRVEFCVCETAVGRSKQSRGRLGAAYHSAALLTGSGPALSPHSSNRCLTGKIFSQLGREWEGNSMFYNTSQWKWWKPKGKTHIYDTYIHIYCPWVNLHLLKADPGKCLQMVGYYLLINISQNSLGPGPFITWTCLTDECRKVQQVSLTYNINIWSVWW